MNTAQLVVFAVLLASLLLFMWGKWRYDLVALMALLAVSLTGVLSPEKAFVGFSHPAVVTVAAVLVVSRGLLNSGLVDMISRLVEKAGARPWLQVTLLTGLVALFSGFMNNVGALALLMPVAIRLAKATEQPVSRLLMPLAFGSLLGGMTTLIGTPPNIIIAAFRTETGAAPFRMFDFAPVGVAVTIAGVLFIALIGWRLLPQRKGLAASEDLFHIEDYITEVRVPGSSTLVGKPLRAVGEACPDVTVVGMVRAGRRRAAPPSQKELAAGDILIVEAGPDALKGMLNALGVELAESKRPDSGALESDEISLTEAVVIPGSRTEGRTVRQIDLRARYGINLLALARQGESITERLGKITFRAGDVLLLQGRTAALQEALSVLGCLPLAERGLRIGQPRRAALALGLFGGTLAATAAGLVPVQIAFVACAMAMVLAGLLTLREAYGSVEWPVIILLGAMIPVGEVLESTGGADLIAAGLMRLTADLPPSATLILLAVGTLLLSNVINNAAAALLMAPIALSAAAGLGISADPLLIGVAIGASAAFLTPIGHQSNTLVMGPGGYRFTDYWRMGLPLSLVTLAVAIPVILAVWPF